MKTLKQFMEGHMHKTCPEGKYYCYDSKKCKKIPSGHYIGKGGYLEKDDDSDSEDSKNGNGGSNNGNGNGNTGSNGTGGNGGGE